MSITIYNESFFSMEKLLVGIFKTDMSKKSKATK